MKTGLMRVASRAAGTRGHVDCVHDEVGICSIYGPGAKKMFRGYWVMKTGEDGLPAKVRKRKKWYQCDFGINGGKLRQPKLSFGGSQEPGGWGIGTNSGIWEKMMLQWDNNLN